MKNKFTCFLITFFFITNISFLKAEEIDLCPNEDFILAFINGVDTDPNKADNAARKLEKIHGEKAKNGEQIAYDVLYNPTDSYLEDFVETFEQRINEQGGILQGRFEFFFEIVNGSGNWWEQIITATDIANSNEAEKLFNELSDLYVASFRLTLAKFLVNTNTNIVYKEHQKKIDSWIARGKKILLVSHSQGSLFANNAYDYAISKTKEPNSIKSVYIAPASPSVRGEYTLADGDIVISGLNSISKIKTLKTTASIPAYDFREPGINEETDLFGHGLLEIYLNPSLETSDLIKKHINTALISLVTPSPISAEAIKEGHSDVLSKALFTLKLDIEPTNIYSNPDLHVIEPDGKSPIFLLVGTRKDSELAGYLGGFGPPREPYYPYNTTPEYYTASCKKDKIKEGIYAFTTKYRGYDQTPEVNIEVSTWKDGVIFGPKSIRIEHNWYLDDLLNVIVKKNSTTEEYLITVEECVRSRGPSGSGSGARECVEWELYDNGS